MLFTAIRAMARSLCLLNDILAQQAVRAEDEDEDQDREGEDVLVFRASRSHSEDPQVGSGKGLEHAQNDTAEQGAREVANAAEYGSGKCLKTGIEADECVDPGELQGI